MKKTSNAAYIKKWETYFAKCSAADLEEHVEIAKANPDSMARKLAIAELERRASSQPQANPPKPLKRFNFSIGYSMCDTPHVASDEDPQGDYVDADQAIDLIRELANSLVEYVETDTADLGRKARAKTALAKVTRS